MGDLTPDDKKGIGNLDDPGLPFDYREREYGTVPVDETRARFQWVSEIKLERFETKSSTERSFSCVCTRRRS